MFNAEGEKTWEAELDIYGKVRKLSTGSLSACPFRYQGQYEDIETGLYYNRFRYYDPEDGVYICQDPIGLSGGNPNMYGYVPDPNSYVDKLGLRCKHNTPAWKAKKWQGKGNYPGKDKWRTVTLKKGTKVYGGLPGQSEFYASANTLNKSGLDKVKFSESLQVKPHDVHGYRPKVGEYILNKDTKVAVSKVSANPQYGSGGGEQYFIENFSNDLDLIKEITLK